MKLERCEQSSERKRLSGYLQPRAVSTGMSSGGLFMFGLPFVGIGTWATLAGTRQIPIDPSKLHAPYWVLATVGAAFLLCGVMLWRMGWKQSKADDRRRRVMADRHADPALADYAWDVRGYSSSRWWPVVRSIVLAVLFGGLITALHMSAVTGTNWLLIAILGVLDLIFLCVIWSAITKTARALKFGGSRIEFARFPFRRSQPVVLRWRIPRGMTRANAGTFTLRCIQEAYEQRGSSSNRGRYLVHEQVWCAVWWLAQSQELTPGKNEELNFELPAEVPATNLSSPTPVFWELAVDLDLAGLDFKETYLVPVY